MRKHAILVYTALASLLFVACSGSGGTSAGGPSTGTTSGATTGASGTTSGATTSHVSGTTAAATAGTTASGSTTGGASGSSSGTTGNAQNTLTGANAFPVVSSFIDFGIPPDAAGIPALLANGQPAAVAVVLGNIDAFPNLCTSVNGIPPPTYQLLLVQVGSTGYIEESGIEWDAGPPVAALALGTYTVGDETVNDEDLSMLPPGSQAIVTLVYTDGGLNGGASCSGPCLWALSGTVTLTSISDAGVTGSFDVILGSDEQPFIDAGELRGTFDTTSVCPAAG